MNNKSPLVPIAFSVVGSTIVIFLDIGFIMEEFKINKFLAFIMMSQVEALYIYLPYLFAGIRRNFTIKAFDWILYAFIFFVSVTPAALQVSKEFVKKYSHHFSNESTVTKGEKDSQWAKDAIARNTTLLLQLSKIEEKGKSDKYQIYTLTQENKELRKTLKGNKKSKDKIVKSGYEEKSSLAKWFELLSIFFSFIVIIIVQWGNARCSNIGSKRRYGTIEHTEPEQPKEPTFSKPEKKKESILPWNSEKKPEPKPKTELVPTAEHPLPNNELEKS